MKETDPLDLGWHCGYRLFAVEDGRQVRGYAVPGDGTHGDWAVAITGVSIDGIERREGEGAERMPVYSGGT